MNLIKNNQAVVSNSLSKSDQFGGGVDTFLVIRMPHFVAVITGHLIYMMC